MRSTVFVIAVLVLAFVASSVGLVYVNHERRALFVRLQALDRKRDAMQVEWGRLKLEQSTWAGQDRIEQIAHNQLGLHAPPMSSVVLVTP